MALRRWTRWLLVGLASVIGLLVVAVALLQTSPVATWAVRRLLTFVPLNPGYTLEVQRAMGNWFTHLELDGVRLLHNDRELAQVERIRAGYDLRQLRGAETRIAEIAIEGVRATARREPDGWDVMKAFRHSADTTNPSKTRPIAIGRLTIQHADVAAELGRDSTVLLHDLGVRMHDLMMGDVAVGVIDTVAGRVAPPSEAHDTMPHWIAFAGRGAATPAEFRIDPLMLASERSRIGGAVVLPRRWDDARSVDRLAVRLDATPLSLADIASWVPGVRPDGELQLALRAYAQNQRATGRLTGRLGDATLAVDASTLVGRNAPTAIQAHGTVHALDPSRVYATAPAGKFDGDLRADLQGREMRLAKGRVDVQVTNTAPKTASASGMAALRRVQLGADLADGRAALAFHAALNQGSVKATGWARPFDSVPSYDVTGTARGLPGTDSLARKLAGRTGDPTLAVQFNVAGKGTALDSAQANGRITLVAVRHDGERVTLGRVPFTLARKQVDARPDLAIAGGRITALASARLDKPLRYEIRHGIVDRVDLGRLAGDTLSAPLSARFSGQGQGSTPAEAAASFRVEIDTLHYGKRRVEQVVATVRLDRGRALLDATGALQGGQLALGVDTRPFDSTRTFVIRRATLDRVDLGMLLDQPKYAGPVTLAVTGRGSQRGTNREFDGRIDVAPSRLGAVAVHGGTVAASLRNDRLTYDASLRTNGGALAAAGDVAGLGTAPAIAVRQGRFDSLDLATLLGRPNLTSRLDGRFTASFKGHGLDSLQGEATVDFLPSLIGHDTLHSGHLALTTDRGVIHADLRGESSAGRVVGQAALQVSDSAGLMAIGGTIAANGWARGVRLDTLMVALRPAPGVIDADTIMVRSNVVELDGGGRVALRSAESAQSSPVRPVPTAATATAPDTLRLVGHARDLAPLMRLIGYDSVAVDSAKLAMTVTGPARQWTVVADGDAEQVLYAGKQVQRAVVRATTTFDTTGMSGLAADLRIEGGALGKVRVNRLAATMRYDSVVALDANALLGDSVRLVTALRGAKTRDSVTALLQRFDMVEGGRTWALEHPTALVLRPRIDIDRLALRSGNHRISIDGVVDRQGSSDLTLQVDSMDLDVFRELGLAPVPGQLDGRLRLAGPAARPTIEGRFGLVVRKAAQDLGQLTTDLSWTGAGLKLDVVAAPRQGGQLTARGTLPWQLTLAPNDTGANASYVQRVADTLAFVVRADSFNLAFFDPFLPPEEAKGLQGLLAVDSRIGGTVEQPRVDGRVQLAGMGVELPPLGIRYRQGELTGDFSGDQFHISRLALRTDKHEELVGQGTVRFRPLTDPALELTAKLNDFRISNSPTLHTMASGDLALQGTMSKPSLTGKLRLGRTEVFQGTEGKAVAAKPVELTPEDLQELAQHFGPASVKEAKAGPGLVERFKLDIDVGLPRDVWFRRNVSPRADIELSGRIRIRQEPGQEMQFFGTVEPTPRRGFLDVYGRNFSLTGGQIYLAGPVDSMKLDVTAEYQVPTQSGPDAGILIDVAAKGRVDSLGLAFTSDPSLGQEDIISYIVTGRPASENPLAEQTSGSPTEAGAEMAFGALTQRVAGAAGSKLGLDVFQIKQDGLRGLTLTAGRYVAPRVFLSLQQPIQLSSDAQRTPGSNLGPGFELEYAIRRWLRADMRGGSLPPRFFLRSRRVY